jgi:PAS domain S-box-containing protein
MLEKPQQSEVGSFHLLADRAKVMIWTSGPDKLCDWFNRAWLEFTGRTMEQELGNGWAEGVYPDDLSRCLSVYTTAFDSREEFSMEYQLRRHDGVYRLVLDIGSPYFSADEEFLGYFGSCIDVTAGTRDGPQPPQPELPRLTRQTRVGERAFASVAKNEARKDPSATEIRAALERMVASESFRTCPRLAAFLRFVIEATLRGESAHLKGYTIAVEALGRSGDFDPQQDPIVRVEAARLRRVIQHYYAGPGAKDFLVIDIPRGRYIPTFRYRRAEQGLPIPSVLGGGFLATGTMRAIPAAVETIEHGAADFIEKPLDGETAVTRVDEVKTAFARRRDGDASLDATPTHFPGYDFLTPREREVLTQIAAGASSKEAGRQLGISFRTIEIHRARIMEKLGAKNAADLVRIVSTRAV